MSQTGKVLFAQAIVLGFILLVGIGMFAPIPEGNVKTVDGAMVALGTALGAAVMALLRSDQRDEQSTANTGKALDAIKAAQESPASPTAPDVTLQPGETAQAAEEPKL